MLGSVATAIVVAIVLIARAATTQEREAFQAMNSCVNQGYPRDFCMRTPSQAVAGGQYCNCANGQLGTRPQPGVCSCFPYESMFPYYPSPTFSDWLR